MGEIKANFIPGSQRPVPVVLTVRDWHTGRSEDWVICQVRLSYVRTINDLVHMGLRPASWLLPIGSMGFCLLLVYVNGFLLSVRLSREIVTAVDSLSYATSQVSKGDLSAKVTVRNRGQLGSLAASFNNMTVDLRRLYDQEKEVARTEWEIALAREVQLQLYGPRKFFSSGTTVWGTNIPARIVSGDLFEIFPYSTSRVGMLCADVSGKGISAAMLASHLHALVQARLLGSEPSHRRPSPGALVSSLNRDLLRRFGQNRFVTMIYGEVDLERNTFCYVNAGRCHPLLISSGGKVTLLTKGNLPVGLFPEEAYEDLTLSLPQHSTLILYTDGVTDAVNAGGEEFGLDRLVKICERLPAEKGAEAIGRSLSAQICDWAGDTEEADDLTLLVLARE